MSKKECSASASNGGYLAVGLVGIREKDFLTKCSMLNLYSYRMVAIQMENSRNEMSLTIEQCIVESE
jgi:hypothetical protein